MRAALVAGILLKAALGCLGAVIVTSPDLAELRSAMEAGGMVKLAFDGTVRLPEALSITKDTTVDATGHTVTLDGGNAVRHFVLTNQVTLRLVNLTLANGRFAAANGEINQGGGYGQGGSIFNLGGTLEVVGCTFTNNQALGGHAGTNTGGGNPAGGAAWGGAIYSVDGALWAKECLFADNQCTGGDGVVEAEFRWSGGGGAGLGGAIYGYNSELRLEGVTFTNNAARGGDCGHGRTGSGGGSAKGGAVAAEFSSHVLNNAITRCVFAGNRANGGTQLAFTLPAQLTDAEGGALFLGGGRMTVESALFTSNLALGGPGWDHTGHPVYGDGNGGAVFNEGELEIRNSALVANQAEGGVLPDPCCVWTVNWAGDASGGAIYNRGVLDMVNSTVAENRAKGAAGVEPFGYAGWSTGGALANEGKAALRNVTLAENSASLASGPGSPEVQGDTLAVVGGSVTLINTILQGAPGQTNVWGSVIDGGHNLSSDGSAKFTTATSRAGVDPLLGPLTDNGGGTPTMALLPGSPAIDAGDDAAAPPGDQRGVGRPVGPRSDIGAFEVGSSGPPEIISGPEDAAVGAGQNVSFSVFASTIPVTYQWQFNGSDLLGATQAVLRLETVPLTQAGEYRVIVSNAAGSVTSPAAVLTVLPPTSPVILAQPQSQSVPEGQPLVLSVTATNLLPLTYQWQRDGVDVPGATHSVLEFESVSLSEAGSYTVVVSTVFLSATSAPAAVTVLPAEFPSILQQPSDQQVKEGQSATFSVVARGGAPLQYQWVFEGVGLPGATNTTLTLDNVRITRAGTYLLRVRNRIGEVASTPAVLDVEPTIVDPGFAPANSAKPGTPATLTVQKDGGVVVVWLSHRMSRFNSDGSLDEDFALPIKGSTRAWLFQPDDKILINSFEGRAPLTRNHLERFNPDGSLDTSFDAGSPTSFPMIPRAIQPDGKILVSRYNPPALLRLDQDGTVDPGFSIDLPADKDLGGVVPQPDGGILVNLGGSTAEPEGSLVRFDGAGVRDPDFEVRFPPGAWLSAMTIQSDGKVIIGGSYASVNGMAATNLARINKDGSLDSTFQPAVIPEGWVAAALDAPGELYVGSNSGLVRLNPEGSLGMSFHPNLGPVVSVVPLNDGRIVIGGRFTDVDGVPRPGLARLYAPGPVPRIRDMLRIAPMVRLSVATLESKGYALQRAAAFAPEDWTVVQTLPGDGAVRVLVDTNSPASRSLYRIRAD